MRFVGYTRVSDMKQVKEGDSMPAQEETILTWAAESGNEIVQIIAEPGHSAAKPFERFRPEFKTLVNKTIIDPSINGLVVCWIDRFARNVEDFLFVRGQLYQVGKHLISIREPLLNGDPGNPTDRFLSVSYMNALQLQAELSGQKAALGRDRKAKQGNYPGTLPLGYTRIERQIIPHPPTWPSVADAFSQFASGKYTLQTWTAEAKKRGYASQRGQVITLSGWHRILRNQFYIGRFSWKGEEYQGDYQTFISDKLFDTVQQILDDHGTGGSSKEDVFFLLSGLLWSIPLEKQMTGMDKKRGRRYYWAKLPGQAGHCIRADELEGRVVTHLATIKADPKRLYTLPERWRLAAKIVPSMRHIWDGLDNETDQQTLLQAIFYRRGISVCESGRIGEVKLLPGFVKSE